MPAVPRSARPAGPRLNAAGNDGRERSVAAVLVGGASRRFGSDKASALFQQRTLLDHTLHTLRAAGFRRLVYVGGGARPNVAFDALHVPDRTGESCTLRGIVSLLEHAANSDADNVMMLSCDVPLVRTQTIGRIVDALGGADAAVAHAHGDHWSCLAVTTSSLSSLRETYESGNFAVHHAFANLRVVRVAVDDDELLNANEPSVLAAAITKESLPRD